MDRHALMRLATVGWVKRCSSLEVCGMAGSMPHALKAVRRLRPDVIVSEIFRPRDLGFIRELHRRHPRLPIIVFSLLDEEAYAPEALAAGACGYLMKGVKGDTLVDAICDALKGRVVFSPAMARRLCRNRESQWAKISILPRPLGL